jgi:ACS family D-galactonate transporter-like MFS transporter
MAAFTETVEKHNPAATATGLAVWGTIRIVATASFALLTAVVPATSALVDQGPRVKAISAPYPQPVKVLRTVDPATLAALKANPADLVAQTRALSQLSGLPAAQVARVALLGARYRPELATLAAVDPATPGALQANPTDRAAGARAVGEIAVRFGIPPSGALARLQAVGRVPPADLLFLRANGAEGAAGRRSLAIGLDGSARRSCVPGPEWVQGGPGPQGQPRPVAELVVDLLCRTGAVHPVPVPPHRTLEPSSA